MIKKVHFPLFYFAKIEQNTNGVYYMAAKISKCFFVLTITMAMIGCTRFNIEEYSQLQPNEEELLIVAKEVASMFDYYDEISASVPNEIVGQSEIGGQCGDYALAFVNKWNARYPGQALLVIQQQGLNQFPDGIYEVTGKDNRNLPFLKKRTTSMLYLWIYVRGIGHPQLGGYKIRLLKRLHITSHLERLDWENNGPHVWVWVGNMSVDPTYADSGVFPIIGKDRW
jgi:hypothetical protein